MALTAAEQKELDSLLAENDSLDRIISQAQSQDTVSRETPQTPSGLGGTLFPSASKAATKTTEPTEPREQIVTPGFGSFAIQDPGESLALPILEDLGTMTTRALGAFKQLITGGGVEGFKQAMQDPEAGILKGSRKETEQFYDDQIKESDNELEKNSLRTLKLLATTGFGIIEDPASIATGIGKIFQKGAKTGSKIAGDVKSTIATQSGIEQEALEQAAKVPVKDIRKAAGKEGELAEEITQAISPKGEKEFIKPLKGQQAQLEESLVDEGLEGVRIKQSQIEEKQLDPNIGGERIVSIPDPSQRLVDPKTGDQIDFPIDILEKAGQEKAFTTQLQWCMMLG